MDAPHRCSGQLPRALNANDWCRFGDMLSKDINVQALTYNNRGLKQEIRKNGGVASLWRNRFPMAAEAACQRYGNPSLNWRANFQYVPYWNACYTIPKPCGESNNCQGYQPAATHCASTLGSTADTKPCVTEAQSSHVKSVPPVVAGGASDSAAYSDSMSDDSSDSEETSPRSAEVQAAEERSVAPSIVGNTKDPDSDSSSRSRGRGPTQHGRSASAPTQSVRSRPRSRSPIRPGVSIPLRTPSTDVTDVWFVAGDEALHAGFHASIREKCDEFGWSLDRVSLPVNMVLHTGVALSQLLFCFDASATAWNIHPNINCVVSEACLKQWPKSCQGAHKSRLDNVNHCLRCFGIDGGSTRQMELDRGAHRSGEFLLRSALRTFIVLGDGPTGHINADTYRRRLSWLNKRALSDESFLEELVYANMYSPMPARNGMRLLYEKGGELTFFYNTVVQESGLGKNVLLIVLDPNGRTLM